MPDHDPTQHLIYEQLYRPTEPNDPLPDPDTSSTTRRLWATAGRIRDALADAGWRKTADPGCICPPAGVMVRDDCDAHPPLAPMPQGDADDE